MTTVKVQYAYIYIYIYILTDSFAQGHWGQHPTFFCGFHLQVGTAPHSTHIFWGCQTRHCVDFILTLFKLKTPTTNKAAGSRMPQLLASFSTKRGQSRYRLNKKMWGKTTNSMELTNNKLIKLLYQRMDDFPAMFHWQQRFKLTSMSLTYGRAACHFGMMYMWLPCMLTCIYIYTYMYYMCIIVNM